MHYPMRPTSGGGIDQLIEQVNSNPEKIVTDKLNGDRAFVIKNPDGEVIVLNRHLRYYTKRNWFEKALSLLPDEDEQVIYDCEMMAKIPKYRGAIAILDIVSSDTLSERLFKITEITGGIDIGSIAPDKLFMPSWSYANDFSVNTIWDWQQEINKDYGLTLFEGVIVKDDTPYEKVISNNGRTTSWLKYKHTN